MAMPFHAPSESFDIPAEAVGRQVDIALAYPLPARGGLGGVGVEYPGVQGKLVANLERSVVVEYVEKNKVKHRVIPKVRIWSVDYDKPIDLTG